MAREAEETSAARKRRYGVWRTADVAEPERYAYFREAVCEGLHGPLAGARPSGSVRRHGRIDPAGRRRGEPGLGHAASRAPHAGADRPVLRAVLFPQPSARVRMRDRAAGRVSAARAGPGRAFRQRPAVPDLPPAGRGYERRLVLAAARPGRGGAARGLGAADLSGVRPSFSRAADRRRRAHPEPGRADARFRGGAGCCWKA